MSGTPHTGISVSPLKATLPHGVTSYSEKVTVANAGNTPVLVHVYPVTVHSTRGGCGISGAPKWITATSIGKLAPGEHRVSVLTVHAPHGYSGDVAMVYAAQAHASGNQSTASAAVGTQVVISSSSTAKAPVCHPAVAAPVGSSGVPATLVGALGVAMLLLVLLAAFVIRGVRRRGSQERAWNTYEVPRDDGPWRP